MRPEITLYGTSFYGAWYGDGDIYNNRIDSAMGRLSGSTLTILDVLHDDRETLSLMMLVPAGASWGMDLPFSLPQAVYQDFSLRDWPALLNFAQAFERADLEHLLEVAELFDPGNECQRPGDGCRVTDAESGAFSPLRRFQPDRLGVTLWGMRLLGEMRGRGAGVYPFDQPARARPKLYETNPATTLHRLGPDRRLGSNDFVEAFNDLPGRAVNIAPLPDHLRGRPYELGALVSCATLANAIRAFDLEESWDERPAFATVPEWEIRHTEGLIVRL